MGLVMVYDLQIAPFITIRWKDIVWAARNGLKMLIGSCRDWTQNNSHQVCHEIQRAHI